jgi:zinc transporter
MSAAAIDTEGLICAFRLTPRAELDVKAHELEPSTASPLWMHFNLLDNRARRYLEQRAPLEEDGRNVLVDKETRVRTQLFPGGFAALLGDLRYDFDADPEGFSALRVYVDARMMITCRQHRLRSVDRLRRRLQAEERVDTPMDLFVQLLDELVEAPERIAAELAETVEKAEDEILAGRSKAQASELGRVRRLLVRLRRHVGANRSALVPLRDRALELRSDEQRQQLRELVERLDAVSQDMDLVTERARLLQEEIAGQLNEATNRNLYVLSIVTTAVLPITLITGVFGMNVGGLPFLDSRHGFGFVMLAMALTVVGTMLFLRRVRVL